MTDLVCEKCNKLFTRKENLIYHVNMQVCLKHHECKYCGKVYKTLRGMDRHIERVHNDSLNCMQIPHKTTQNHTNSTQNHTKPHKLTKIGRKIMNVYIVKRHLVGEIV